VARCDVFMDHGVVMLYRLTRSSATARKKGRQLGAFVSSLCYSRAFGFLEFSYTLRVGLLTKSGLNGNRRMRVYKNST